MAIAAGVSLVVGWATSGDLIYHSLIGLDSSFFPAGEWIQSTLAPGAVDTRHGIVHIAPNLPGWRETLPEKDSVIRVEDIPLPSGVTAEADPEADPFAEP